ncbi:MAG TPA: DUF1266 domain-containing protein [Chitinolyticbacter sp.]|nr:DUF1266 domain-containing protein [Chitinolyticbacter sp.]
MRGGLLKLVVWAIAFAALLIWLACKLLLAPLRWLLRSERKTEGVAFSRRRWALAVGDVLFRRNEIPSNTDELIPELAPERVSQLRALALAELGVDATDPALHDQVQQCAQTWLTGLGRDTTRYLAIMAEQGLIRDALAFSAARTAFLIRTLAIAGLLRAEQAWLVLFINAQRVQDMYASWEDYGQSYARGRDQWLRLHGDGVVSRRAEQEVAAYLRDASGNWRQLPWRAADIYDPRPVLITQDGSPAMLEYGYDHHRDPSGG